MKVKSSLRSAKARFSGLQVVTRGKRKVVVIPKKFKHLIPGRAKARQGSK